jgi:hypothetical protein
VDAPLQTSTMESFPLRAAWRRCPGISLPGHGSDETASKAYQQAEAICSAVAAARSGDIETLLSLRNAACSDLEQGDLLFKKENAEGDCAISAAFKSGQMQLAETLLIGFEIQKWGHMDEPFPARLVRQALRLAGASNGGNLKALDLLLQHKLYERHKPFFTQTLRGIETDLRHSGSEGSGLMRARVEVELRAAGVPYFF